MQKIIEAGVNDYSYTQNRELSWLRFNRRVLEEAMDESVPLLERLKFISIFSSNLDEFFMVRVGSIFDISQVSPQQIDSKSGMNPSEQLGSIYHVIPSLMKLKKEIYTSVTQKLRSFHIEDVSYEELNQKERTYVNKYFQTSILPLVSPVIVGSHHPTPNFINKNLYIAVLVRDSDNNHSLGFIPVPSSLPSVILLPKENGRYIRLENILLHWADKLFGDYAVEKSCVIAVTRNADISFDQDKFEDAEEDFREHVAKLLKKRASLSIMRLEVSQRLPEDFLKLLKKIIQVKTHQIYFDSCPLNMQYVYQLEKLLPLSIKQPLLYETYVPRWPEDVLKNKSMIDQIRKKDKLLYFPYDSVDPFLQLLSEAAVRPDVLSIKITIYRLASSSKIVQTLCRAAENGKEVTVLMELRARFDESNNIGWSELLENAGCQVIYGVEEFKCHSKICLITLKVKDKLSYITQIGTGNYNEKTNTLYTDLSFMTASQEIGEDGVLFFQNMLVNQLNGNYKKLLVAPFGIKQEILRLIDEQIKKGEEGYICMKANSITERRVIDKLKEASLAGVEIQLIIRGICCLRPGIPHKTENIHITSIVGRYLEHARIYCFGKGEDAKLFISSADLMTRNLNRRVEIACPIFEKDIQEKLLWILSVQLEDTEKASVLRPDGSYLRKNSHSLFSVNSQQVFMDYSIHTEEEAKEERVRAFQRIWRYLMGLLKRYGKKN